MPPSPYRFHFLKKSHPFRFEESFDKHNYDLYYSILDIEATRKSLNALRTLPSWADAVHERVTKRLLIDAIHGTLAIGGNPSTEKDVEDLFRKPEDPAAVYEENEQERHNIRAVCAFIQEKAAQNEGNTPIKVSEDLIKELHGVVTRNITAEKNVPGQYRNSPAEAGHPQYGGIYEPPGTRQEIEPIMADYVEWLNSEQMLKEYPVFRAILAHYFLTNIHPFAHGNGMTARAVESLILEDFNFGYGTAFVLWKCFYEHFENYFTLLSKTRKENEGNQTEYVVFVLKILQAALSDTYKSIVKVMDELLFKDYIALLLKEEKLSSRQHAIVNFLLERQEPISKKELSDHPVVAGLYEGRESRTRLFQLDMRNITKKLALFRKVRKEKRLFYVPNYEAVIKTG